MSAKEVGHRGRVSGVPKNAPRRGTRREPESTAGVPCGDGCLGCWPAECSAGNARDARDGLTAAADSDYRGPGRRGAPDGLLSFLLGKTANGLLRLLAEAHDLAQAVLVERPGVLPGAVAVLVGPFQRHGVERPRLALDHDFAGPDGSRAVVHADDRRGLSLHVLGRLLRCRGSLRRCLALLVRVHTERGEDARQYRAYPTGPPALHEVRAAGGCMKNHDPCSPTSASGNVLSWLPDESSSTH